MIFELIGKFVVVGVVIVFTVTFIVGLVIGWREAKWEHRMRK